MGLLEKVGLQDENFQHNAPVRSRDEELFGKILSSFMHHALHGQ